jgi:NAD(P)-dependent dehydrogenase (short-subunit alcohol dehydrogenase family)
MISLFSKKKSNIKIIEIGASSLLDFDYKKHLGFKDIKVEWIKHFNRNKPKYYSKVLSIKNALSDNATLRRNLFNTDAVIYSIGNKGPRTKFHMMDPDQTEDLLNVNFTNITKTLPRIIRNQMKSKKHLKVIFMGSVAGKEDNTYPNHAIYAASKAALSSLVRNLQEEYKGNNYISFHLFEIPYTSSRMTGGKGDSPDNIRDQIIELITRT